MAGDIPPKLADSMAPDMAQAPNAAMNPEPAPGTTTTNLPTAASPRQKSAMTAAITCTATGLPNFTYDVDLADPANVVLTDPAGWGQAGFVKFPRVEDELTSLRLGAERSFDDGI